MISSQIIKDLFLDAFWEVIYFPYWWYTDGLKKAINFSLKKIGGGWQATALSLLLAAFFKPMYSEKGFAAYLLSFIVRSWQLSWRFLFMLVWAILWLLAILVWLLLPAFAVFKLIIG